jgi:CheY-like chemotaxis protein
VSGSAGMGRGGFRRRGSASGLPTAERRVLVVDDSPSARKLLQQLLLRLGFGLPELRIASGSEEAMRLFTEWTPDIVFLDLELRTTETAAPPSKRASVPPSGADLAFKFLERNPSVKIIVCSASEATDTRVAELVNAGTVQAMVKPLIAGKIQEALSRLGALPASFPRSG